MRFATMADRLLLVSPKQDAIWPFFFNYLFGSGHDPSRSFHRSCAPCIKEMIRFPDTKFLKKNIFQIFIEILPGVDEDMFTLPIQLFDDPAQADKFRARAQDRHHFHRQEFPFRFSVLFYEQVVSF